MKNIKVCAIDLGASSGRGIIGEFDGEKLSLSEISRFKNGPVDCGGTLRWNFESLKKNVLASAEKGAGLGARSVGIDTWGVDYGYIKPDGNLSEAPINYRNPAIADMPARFYGKMSFEKLYSITGIQNLNFNSVYRIYDDAENGRIPEGAKLLFMPDLFNYYLTGKIACEYTDASTGALIDAKTRQFSDEVLKAAGVDRTLFGELVTPGNVLGKLNLPGVNPVDVVNVPSHDTASAVLSVPTDKAYGDFVYISSGTWSLMGTELQSPILTAEALRMNWTNEGGAYGTVRFLKNIMGLWLLQESRRIWTERGLSVSFDELSDEAAKAPRFASLINPNSDEFTAPGDMPARIADYCRRTSQPVPDTPGQFVRLIFDSLALCYRHTSDSIAKLTGKKPSAVNIVGGGSKDVTLNALTADVCGLPVIAGPTEATAIGNIITQLISAGEIANVREGREIISRSFDTKIYTPDKDRSIYDRAYEKYLKLI